jgi:ATP-binding cassette subfamily F protein 3
LNGAGKTTLLRAAAGILAPDAGEIQLGKGQTVGHLSQDHIVAPDRTLWDEVFGVLEPIRALEQRANALLQAAEGSMDEGERLAKLEEAEQLLERFRREDGWQLDARCGRVLSGLGFIQQEWHQPARDLSGGRRVVAGLARLLLQRPTFLLLDEPTNHLDIETRTWLLQELKGWPGGVLVISHDRDSLDRLCTKTVEIARGRLWHYGGGYSSYLRQREAAISALRAKAEAQAEERARLQAFIDRFRAKPTKAAQVQSRIRMLEKMEPVIVPAPLPKVRLRFPEPPPAASPMLEIRDLAKSYGPKRVLEDVDASVYPGERILLVGPNGAGKSTLLGILAGLVRPDGGVVQELPGTRIAYFAQDQAIELSPNVSVLAAVGSVDPLLSEARLRGVLGALLFTGDDVQKRCGVLSGGEKSRVALGRVLLRRANLLLLDEPTNHLDIHSKEVLAEALEAFTGTVIFVSHDREFANRLATHVWAVGGGGMTIHRGNLDDFLWDRAVAAGIATRRAPGEQAPDHWLLQGLPDGADAGTGPRIESDAEPVDLGRGAWKDRKRRASDRRRTERRADELMAEIETLEALVEELDGLSAGGEGGWERLAEVARDREEAAARAAAAWAEWESIDAALGTDDDDSVS